jgi:hypothetical protein
MKSQMNALKQRLDTKPALPQGFPTGRTIATAGQIASHVCDGRALGSCRHLCGSLTSLCSNNGEQIGFEDGVRGTLRFSAPQVSQVQQTNSQGREVAQQADQTIGALHLALFETASGFETLVIVFHERAVLIPPDAPGIPARAL